MTTFTVSVMIHQSPEVVTQALNNPDNFVYWTTDLEKFEVIRGGANEVGSIAHLHYSQGGRSTIMEDKLIYCEPGKKYISEVTGDALTARVETTLRPLDDNTEMCLVWSGKGRVFLLRLLLPLLRGRIARQAQHELEIFKNLVETRGSDFSTP